MRLSAWRFGPWKWMEMVVVGLSMGLNIGAFFYLDSPAYLYVSRYGDVALAIQFGVMIAGFYRFSRQNRKLMYEIERNNTLFEMEVQRFDAHFQATMGPFLRKQMGRDYIVTPDAIVCLYCGAVSRNPNDVRERFCGKCHRFLGIAGPSA